MVFGSAQGKPSLICGKKFLEKKGIFRRSAVLNAVNHSKPDMLILMIAGIIRVLALWIVR